MRRSYYSIVALLGGTLFLTTSVGAQNQIPQNQIRNRLTQQANDQQSAKTVKQTIAKKLEMANKAEIELAKMAQEKSKNSQLTKLAETLVSDHQELNEKLKKLELDSKKTGNRAAINRQNSPVSPTGRQAVNRPALNNRGQAESMVPPILCDIMDKASENALSMTKDMLQNYDGEEFDMAFVGQQVVAHVMLIAELKAIESQDLDQVSQLAGEATSTVEQHLEELKKLAKELKDNSSQD